MGTITGSEILAKSMKSQGIDSRPYFHLLCDMPPYQGCRRVGRAVNDTPVAASLSARNLQGQG